MEVLNIDSNFVNSDVIGTEVNNNDSFKNYFNKNIDKMYSLGMAYFYDSNYSAKVWQTIAYVPNQILHKEERTEKQVMMVVD